MNRFGFAILMCLAVAQSGFAAGGEVNFSRDIRPILSENCFACHGPDEEGREAKLRLDTKEGALASDGEMFIIKPGESGNSELIKRVTATVESDVMPPPETGKKLTQAQTELLKKWIDQGAKWETHWAFEKPVRPELPEVENKAWPRNEIDYFVLEKLEKEGLEPAPEADKEILARRATLDLTGLPPSLDELDAYLADGSDEAYGKLVEQLLNSARYGEKMARYWLDGARYADSHGYHIDSTRSIWKYREWVIDAFNQNMPFDQFTKEQLAGDLLPNATVSQKVGSGYIRCNMSTGEGGAIEEEYRSKYMFDRLETTSTLWLGLTMSCARCHTHKYDPITHHEYYELAAFFNSLEEPVMDGNKPNPDPFLKIPSPQQAERLAWLEDSISKAEKKLEEPIPTLDEAQPAWQSEWHERLNSGWTPLDVSVTSSTEPAVFKKLDDQSVLVERGGSDEVVWTLTAPLPESRFAGLRLEMLPIEKDDGSGPRVVRLAELEAEVIPSEGEAKPRKLGFAHATASAAMEGVRSAIDGKAETQWTVTNNPAEERTAIFLLKEPEMVSGKLQVRLKLKGIESAGALRRFRLSVAARDELLAALYPVKLDPWKVIGPFEAPDIQAGLAHEFPPEKEIDFNKTYPGVRDPIRWNAQPGYEDGRPHVFVQYLHGIHGAYYFHRVIQAAAPGNLEIRLRADDLVKLWLNGKLVATRAEEWRPGDQPLRVALELAKGENQLLVKVVNLQGESRFTFDKKLAGDEFLPTELAAILAATPTPAGGEAKRIRDHYRATKSPEWSETSENLGLWRQEHAGLERSIPTTLVAKEAAKPRDTFVLTRGEYDKPTDQVYPGVPAILPPLPRGTPTNRLGLAEWLVDPDHPLTARVVVNRYWQHYFGVGLVKTVEDFGMQSENPSHPQLLDWLATEFIRSGWDVKHIQRLIVTSATYRQSTAAPAELYSRDPENRLLARGPRFRLDAETIRDTALALGGLLVEEIGGGSVKPYQPAGLWEAVSFNNSQKYVQDNGSDQYRRSLYIYWKRQSPPPNMLLFDAPTREYCVVRRPRTNTPLQALVLMNDPQFVESSRGFAARILREGGDKARSRIRYAFRLATSRDPGPEEVELLEGILKEQLEAFSKKESAAEKLLKVGSWQPAGDVNETELAAWTTLASMILNLDETVTKH